MKTFPFIIFFAGVLFTQVAQGEEIQPGSWSVEMTMSMGNQPMPANATTICLQNVNDMVGAGAGCSAVTTSANGNHVDMNISCGAGGLNMNGTGSLTVSRTAVDGTFNLAMQMPQGPAMQTVSILHAVRVGDCKQ